MLVCGVPLESHWTPYACRMGSHCLAAAAAAADSSRAWVRLRTAAAHCRLVANSGWREFVVGWLQEAVTSILRSTLAASLCVADTQDRPPLHVHGPCMHASLSMCGFRMLLIAGVCWCWGNGQVSGRQDWYPLGFDLNIHSLLYVCDIWPLQRAHGWVLLTVHLLGFIRGFNQRGCCGWWDGRSCSCTCC